MQERYWKSMFFSRYTLNYLDTHFALYVLLDRIIRFSSAILSALVLGLWVFLQKYELLWGSIIVFTQIVSMINSLLPYKKRIKEIADLKERLMPIYIDIENSWFDVSKGNLSEKEINKLITKHSKVWQKEDSHFFNDDILPQYKKHVEKATQNTEKYFKNCM